MQKVMLCTENLCWFSNLYFGHVWPFDPSPCFGSATCTWRWFVQPPLWHCLTREDRTLLITAAVSDVCDVFKLINDGYVADILPCKGYGLGISWVWTRRQRLKESNQLVLRHCCARANPGGSGRALQSCGKHRKTWQTPGLWTVEAILTGISIHITSL